MDDVAQRDDQQSTADDADGEQDEEDAGEIQGSGSCRVFARSNGLADPQIRSGSRPRPILAQHAAQSVPR
jgi:hypothetical protein